VEVEELRSKVVEQTPGLPQSEGIEIAPNRERRHGYARAREPSRERTVRGRGHENLVPAARELSGEKEDLSLSPPPGPLRVDMEDSHGGFSLVSKPPLSGARR
jgi:hypothetical protein